jgi:hypothetical protein
MATRTLPSVKIWNAPTKPRPTARSWRAAPNADRSELAVSADTAGGSKTKINMTRTGRTSVSMSLPLF